MANNEVLNYYVQRSKILDLIEPDLLRIKSTLDRIEETPWNLEEEKLKLYGDAARLIKLWERESGVLSTLL